LIEELRIYQAELEVQNAELRESQAIAEVAVGRSSAFFSSLPFAALVIERSGMILEASAEAMRLFRLGGIRGRPRFLANLLDKCSTAQLGDALVIAAATGCSVQHEVVFRTSEDTTFTGELHVARLPARDGEVMELVCAIVDLTEPLAQAEAIQVAHRALTASERRYRILADYSLDWDYWAGPDGRYRYVSPACKALTGYPPEAFLADSGLFRRLLHPDDRTAWDRHLADTHPPANTSHGSMRLRLIGQSGQMRWVEHQCQPVFDDDGAYSGRRGVNRDVTARHAAERTADRLSRLYNTLGQSNRATVQYRLRRADGSYIWVETTSRQFRAEGDGELTLVATTRDISERRRAEERLRQSARAFESAAEGVTVSGREGNIVSVNRAFTEITGYSEAEVLGQNPRILQSGRHDRALYEGMWASLGNTGRWCGELWEQAQERGDLSGMDNDRDRLRRCGNLDELRRGVRRYLGAPRIRVSA
jgi:PAS domain S-box-containing protein